MERIVLKWVFCIAICLSYITSSAQNISPLQVADEIMVKVGPQKPYGKSRAGYVFEHDFENPGASYVNIHFKSFDLAPGDYVEVLSPSTGESWIFSEKGKVVDGGERMISEFWSGSVLGDKAKVRLWSNSTSDHEGFIIDRVAYGYSESLTQMNRSICGGNDSEDIICYDGTAVYTNGLPVCKIIINGVSTCTGWLLGSEGHVITNNHCISNASDAINSTFQFNFENQVCAEESPAVTDQVANTSTLVCTNAALDYTLVQLPDNVTATYGFLRFRATPPVINERIYLPQHPQGQRKKVTVNDDLSPTGFARIQDNGDRVEYFADTNGGSSGSPVLSWNDNLVVALHNTGGCENGGNRNDNIIADMGACLPLNAVGNIIVLPVADFTSSVSCLTVGFTDLSTNSPNAWRWDFGDGDTSNMQHPTHIYSTFGSYTVTLIATNDNGADTIVMPDLFTLVPDPAPVTTAQVLCVNSSTTLAAEGANSFDWYSDAAGGDLITTGSIYKTGPISSDTTFYVGTSGDCASTLTPLTITTVTPVPDSVLGATGCEGESLNLQAFGSGDMIWYDTAVGGTRLFVGPTFNTGTLNTTQSFFVAASDTLTLFSQSVGPIDNSIGTGVYQNLSNGLVFDALSDITLVSVWVDAGSAGNRDIQVSDFNGNVIASTTVFIPAGQGRVPLGLNISQGFGHRIRVLSSSLIDLFRNNNGVNYPYTSDHVVIRSSTLTLGSDLFYYHLYDWEVLGESFCEGTRSEVSAVIAPGPISITLIGNTLDAGPGFTGYQWFLNGSEIAGATFQTYTPLSSASYFCVVDANGCSGTSNSLQVTATNVEEQFETFGFALWPNPVTEELNVRVGTEAGVYQLYTISGALVFEGNFANSFKLNVSSLDQGSYLMKLITPKGDHVQRLVVQ